MVFFFFFNDAATTEIYTLSLHDALPILDAPRRPRRRVPPAADRHREHRLGPRALQPPPVRGGGGRARRRPRRRDRKSTRLNSSHANISYAVFCLKKKKHIIILTELISPR